MGKREKVRRRLAVVEAEDGTAKGARLRLLSAPEACASRAVLAPKQLHVHSFAVEREKTCAEKFQQKREKAWVLLFIATSVVRESTRRLQSQSCFLPFAWSAHLEIARPRVPLSAQECAREGSPGGRVRCHKNRSARNFLEHQSFRCAFSVIAVILAKRKRVRIPGMDLFIQREQPFTGPTSAKIALSAAEGDCTEDTPEGSTFGITRPASQTTPSEQHVTASTVIGVRCVLSRPKSTFEGSYSEDRKHQRARTRWKTQTCQAPVRSQPRAASRAQRRWSQFWSPSFPHV